MASVFDVARYILNHTGGMPTLKLHRLVYYCQAWSLAWDGIPLFEEDFQAWESGPVCPELFSTHRDCFWVGADYYNNNEPYPFTQDQIDTINAVLDGYANERTQWLSELTHKERLWREIRQVVKPGEPCVPVISKDRMKKYYGGLE